VPAAPWTNTADTDDRYEALQTAELDTGDAAVVVPRRSHVRRFGWAAITSLSVSA